MDVLFSLHKKWCNMIFNGKKPIEFRSRLPKDFSVGDKIYIYETSKQSGCKMIVGHCEVKEIINVLNNKGNYPTFGAYPFIDYYFEQIKGDLEIANRYKEIKEEFFEKFDKYKYGFILQYVFSDENLENIRQQGCPIDTWKIFDMKLVTKILDDIEKSNNAIKECDEWLKEIGYYNDFDESYYKYGIVLTNITQYKEPKQLNEFINKNGIPLKSPPQSWMYVNEKGLE